MIRYVAFLSGINANGQQPMSAEDLMQHFIMPGIENVKIYIQADNVLFDADEADEAKLCRDIEVHLKKSLGYDVKVILRMIHEIKNVIRNNPYPYVNSDDARNLYVTFLSDAPPPSVRGALEVYSNDAEDARLMKREVYVLSSNYGKTRFSNSVIEKRYGVTATTRNWNTLSRLLEL